MRNLLLKRTLIATTLAPLLMGLTPAFADEISVEICPPDPCHLSVIAMVPEFLHPATPKPPRLVTEKIRERSFTVIRPNVSEAKKTANHEIEEHTEISTLPWSEQQNISTSEQDHSQSDDALFASNSALSNEDLGEMRGAFTQFTAESLGVAVLEANSVNNITNGGVTGNNVATDGALAGAQGVVSFVQNSGNNTIIQSATVVNLYFDDPATSAAAGTLPSAPVDASAAPVNTIP